MSETSYEDWLRNLPIEASLSPHPLGEHGEMEPEWLAWIPGFDVSEDPDSGEHPLFRDENIAIYQKVEALAVSHFRQGFAVLAPLFKDYHFKTIHIACDSIGLLGQGGSALAAFNVERSRTLTGIYVFHLYSDLINRYLMAEQGKYELDADDNDIWVHELIHLLDNHNILSASVYHSSDSPAENFKSWLLKFRDEGTANLNRLLSGNSEIRTMQEALDQFKLHISDAERMVGAVGKTDYKFRDKLYEGYFFYTVGPWVVLEAIRNVFLAWDVSFVEESIARAERKEPVDQATIREILKLALLLTPAMFLEEINGWRSDSSQS